ncbi:hypothetical protein BHE74_00003941 [Ensete ventricosum]|nr:hypothetical protein GW17_00024710 [Ensete ventricosum]RWW87245.1 hypothetical protein BHE74_00003941 [Ensete ventricosum]RZR87604.1 hypothetical protein BHM03_00015056 [Ensete ventricosum]
MSLTSIQGKFHASALCFIIHDDSFYAAWVLHQVSFKLLYSSVYIELMVALTSTILRVSSPLSSISTSTLSVPLFGVALSLSPT